MDELGMEEIKAEEQSRRSYSVAAIMSFILGFLLLPLLLLVGYLDLFDNMIIGFLGVIPLAGILMGIAGIDMEGRKKIFAILGLVINILGLVFLGVIFYYANLC